MENEEKAKIYDEGWLQGYYDSLDNRGRFEADVDLIFTPNPYGTYEED